MINDESGVGKGFQTVAFISSLCNGRKNDILIVCQSKCRLLRWYYHCSILLKNAEIKIADDDVDDIISTPNANDGVIHSHIQLATVEYVLKEINRFQSVEFECIIFNDEELNFDRKCFDDLARLQRKFTLVLCSEDVMVRHSFPLLSRSAIKSNNKSFNSSRLICRTATNC